MGASINPTTGDYSRGASGFWVENGRDRAAGERMHRRRQPPRHAAHDPPGQRRAAASLAPGAEPPRRGAGDCRKLTSRSSRRRRGRRARSRWRASATRARCARSRGLGPVSEVDLAVDRLLAERLPRGPARTTAGCPRRARTARRGSAARARLRRRPDRRHPRLPRRRAGLGAVARRRRGRAAGGGVVHLPALGRTYAAAAGQGARLNGAPIAASARTELEGARRPRHRQPAGAGALARAGARGRAPLPPVARLPPLPRRRGRGRRRAQLPRHLGVGRGRGRPHRPRGRRASSPSGAGAVPGYNRPPPLLAGLIAAAPGGCTPRSSARHLSARRGMVRRLAHPPDAVRDAAVRH